MAEALGIVASVCGISGLHYAASTNAILVHEILERLYYVPIVVAAIRYGAQGGLATALLASAFYLPHIVTAWSAWPVFEVGQYGEVILFNVVGALTGIMADRLRSERNRYRQASEELKAAYEQLKVSAEERVKSERMATVGRVAAGMAHEIRTPLGALLGSCEILSADYSPNHPKAEFVDIAKKEVIRIERVVKAFLEFAQPPPAAPQPVDLNDLVKAATRLLGPTLAERGASAVELNLLPTALPITVDAHQVERAVVDLTLAACLLAPQGSLTLSTADCGAVAEIAVTVGPYERGLPCDLFEPFADHDHVAHGLTLPVVKRLVENQGGTVRAEMTGHRARFVVDLPTSNTAAPLPLPVTSRRATSSSAPTAAGRFDL